MPWRRPTCNWGQEARCYLGAARGERWEGVAHVARNIDIIVEEQVKRWLLEQQDLRNAQEGEFAPAPLISLSNQIGSNGHPVAHKVGELLGIPVHDREIVEHIATSAKVHVEVVESLDQRAQGRVDDYLTNLFRDRNFDQGDYLRALTRTIAALWAHGTCVLVGRGAPHIVWRKKLLSVRTVAPFPQRLRRVEDVYKLDKGAAEKLIHRTDAERAAFIRKYFAADIDDPLSYDLVLNMAGLDTARASRIIVEAFRQKFEQ